MLIQMSIVFLMVSFPDFIIITDNRVQGIHHIGVSAKRIMLQIRIKKDFRVQAFRDSCINIEPCVVSLLFPLALVEISQSTPY